jgi:hypothetical protein
MSGVVIGARDAIRKNHNFAIADIRLLNDRSLWQSAL